MKRSKALTVSIILLALAFGATSFTYPELAEAKTHNKVKTTKEGLSDASFTNVDALTVTQIQNILSSNNSFLKNFKEGGRSAAQIIHDAAHGHGDASSSMNGISINKTISPVAILATLQKEQSLITMRTKNDGSLNAAMGYACPDSGGCNSKYKGFTKQVENGAWQLRYNFERAKSRGFKDFQVGQTVKIDGKKIKIATRVDAALLRYTPHSNSSFKTFFAKWSPAQAVAGASTAVATTTTTVSATNVTASTNCNLIKSKSLRRTCTIDKAKLIAAAKAKK